VHQQVLQYEQSAHDQRPVAFVMPNVMFVPRNEFMLLFLLAANCFYPLNNVEQQLYNSRSEWRPCDPNADNAAAAAAAAAGAAVAPPPPPETLMVEETSALAVAGTAEQPSLLGQTWAGRSDFCLMLLSSVPGASDTPIAVGEMKRPGVVKGGTGSLVERYSCIAGVRNSLSQVFEYMVNSRVGFGVLSTLKDVWLLRRVPEEPGCLQVCCCQQMLPAHTAL
jgi:hypothetical protein